MKWWCGGAGPAPGVCIAGSGCRGGIGLPLCRMERNWRNEMGGRVICSVVSSLAVFSVVMRAVTRLGKVDDSVAGWIGGGSVLHTERTVTLLPYHTAAFLSRSAFIRFLFFLSFNLTFLSRSDTDVCRLKVQLGLYFLCNIPVSDSFILFSFLTIALVHTLSSSLQCEVMLLAPLVPQNGDTNANPTAYRIH